MVLVGERSDAGRSTASRAAASGFLSPQERAGGGASEARVDGGNSDSGQVRARSMAAIQRSACRRLALPPKIGSATSASRVAGCSTAADTIALSGRIRPGAVSR